MPLIMDLGRSCFWHLSMCSNVKNMTTWVTHLGHLEARVTFSTLGHKQGHDYAIYTYSNAIQKSENSWCSSPLFCALLLVILWGIVGLESLTVGFVLPNPESCVMLLVILLEGWTDLEGVVRFYHAPQVGENSTTNLKHLQKKESNH